MTYGQDGIMKHLNKALLLASSAAAMLIACSAAHASKAIEFAEQQTPKDKSHFVGLMPQSDMNNQHNIIYAPKRIRYSVSLLSPTIATAKKASHGGCNAKKKNELYELSAIFNDKLQLFLSYFDEPHSYTLAEKQDQSSDVLAKPSARF